MDTPAEHDAREPVTYTPVSDDDRAAARARARQRLAEADAQHGPDYYERLRARFGITEHRAA